MFCTQGHNQWVESSLNISSVFIFIVLSIFKKNENISSKCDKVSKYLGSTCISSKSIITTGTLYVLTELIHGTMQSYDDSTES